MTKARPQGGWGDGISPKYPSFGLLVFPPSPLSFIFR
jgi:hypothetical protein